MSILGKLFDHNIVDFTLISGNKTMNIEENCDCYFSVKLNKSEFGEMIKELEVLHKQMVEE